MNEANVSGTRPLSRFLRLAVMAGVESAVQIHIERGDDLNARDASGMTPLMLSAARNKPAICKLLLSAGADHGLLDPAGKSALEIAIASGSEATAAILDAIHASNLCHPPAASAHDTAHVPAIQQPPPSAPSIAATSHAAFENVAEPVDAPGTIEPSASETPRAVAAVVDEIDEGELDLSGWEAEEESTRPDADLTVLNSASAIQIAITAHKPIDSSTEWNDVDTYLPEEALPLVRAEDAEGRAQLRLLLLRAIREGSVPSLNVQAQSNNEDRSANSDAAAYLAMVINDLGAEVDERFEYADADDNFEVFIDPEETPDEEATLDDALVAIDRAASPRQEPLQIYQREFQRLPLLTADEEIQIGKDMEAALDEAIDALAEWPDGIARVLAAGANAIAGSRPLSSVWAGGVEPDIAPASGEDPEETAIKAESEHSIDQNSEQAEEAAIDAGDAAFVDAHRRLAAMVKADAIPKPSASEIRYALTGLRLNRRFLLELIDTEQSSAPCAEFRCAMDKFRRARDRMTAANLKLAFFHAKKYLYSGEPLDDLAQEGNIGLLTAVDRYDWRRGFRFSTYATWWIRQQIGRYVADKVRTIRIPVHLHEKFQRLERTVQAFEKANGQAPTLDELAERMEMQSHKLAALLQGVPNVVYIDEPIIEEMIATEAYSVPDPADVVNKIQLTRAVNSLISSLSTQDRKEEWILRMRFGIGINEALTLEEIGTRFEVTRERIRQIEAKAIKKLRHSTRSEPFSRLALGVTYADTSPAAGNQGSTPEKSPAAAKRAPAREPIHRTVSPKPTALDQVLEQAAKLGISIEDGRNTDTGSIWVNVASTKDKLHWKLVRTLTKLGFEHWPGKGYWK